MFGCVVSTAGKKHPVSVLLYSNHLLMADKVEQNMIGQAGAVAWAELWDELGKSCLRLVS